MAITRLQQARQLYAVGQLVSKTLDGSRPGYRGDDAYGGNAGTGGNSGNTGGDRPNPHTASGTSKTSTSTKGPKSYDGPGNIHSNDPKAPPAYEMIGGKKYDVTPDTRQQRELARMKQTILDAPLPNITKKGIEYYDQTTGKLLGFAPTKTQNPFSLKNIATNVVLGIVAPQLLGPKFATGMKAYNIAKTASKFAKDIGLTDKNVVGAFTDTLTSNLSDKFSEFGKGKKSTTTTSINEDLSKIGNGDGGLDSLGNMDALNQEYISLLNKFNTGAFTDSDQVRFTFLKKMLGK